MRSGHWWCFGCCLAAAAVSAGCCCWVLLGASAGSCCWVLLLLGAAFAVGEQGKGREKARRRTCSSSSVTRPHSRANAEQMSKCRTSEKGRTNGHKSGKCHTWTEMLDKGMSRDRPTPTPRQNGTARNGPRSARPERNGTADPEPGTPLHPKKWNPPMKNME